jgi:hypothetical protein
VEGRWSVEGIVDPDEVVLLVFIRLVAVERGAYVVGRYRLLRFLSA